MADPSSIKELVSLWPGLAELAEDLGTGYETVRGWPKRGSIPVSWWPGVISSASLRGIPGITADLLMRIHTPVCEVERAA